MPDYPSKIKWDNEHFLRVSIKFHRNYDNDIVAFLESKGSERNKFIKTALREYMENHKDK